MLPLTVVQQQNTKSSLLRVFCFFTRCVLHLWRIGHTKHRLVVLDYRRLFQRQFGGLCRGLCSPRGAGSCRCVVTHLTTAWRRRRVREYKTLSTEQNKTLRFGRPNVGQAFSKDNDRINAMLSCNIRRVFTTHEKWQTRDANVRTRPLLLQQHLYRKSLVGITQPKTEVGVNSTKLALEIKGTTTMYETNHTKLNTERLPQPTKFAKTLR